MSDINLQITVKEDNFILFKRCIRRLLESTFLLKEKEERLYAFLAKESNRQDVSDYLRMIGYDVLVDEKCELAMLTVNEADAETVGLKRANIVTFSGIQYHLLLALWETYLENLGYDESVFITRGDLIDKLKSFGLQLVSAELKAAFKLFKKYNLIDYDEEENGEDAKIRLYPSCSLAGIFRNLKQWRMNTCIQRMRRKKTKILRKRRRKILGRTTNDTFKKGTAD